uniref:Calcium-channel protein CCH1 n=1 Tax=Globisporangium ultimum (strain ATCC 200006 / CBS 805.95 / DAOM BR144) TaxID=431595 RepID=K3WWJ6_GLOUD
MTLVEIQEHAPFESLNALIVPTGDENSTYSAFARFQKFVFCKKFDDFITGCIVVNTFFLLLEYPNMNKSLRVTLSVTEYLFGSIFGLEMIVRIIAMKGLRAYLHSTERRFDMVVVVCTTINMVLNNVNINFSGLNSVSSLRTLRVSRLMLKYEGTRKLIESVLKSSRGVMDVVMFLVLFQVVTSILAMQLFGGGHLHSADNTPRWNFDTFGRSFLTLLQVITGDQWSSITYDAVDAENPHWLMIPFLVVVFIIGQYVLLNLFIAVILENFSISEEEAYQLQLAQIIAIPKELDIFEKIEECGVCVFGEMDKLDNVSNVKLRMFLGLDDNHNTAIHSNEASRVSNGRFMHKNGGSNTKAQHSRNILSELNQEIQARWKRFCFRLATSAWFSRLVQIVIVISCANLIIDDPHPEMSLNPPSDELTRALTIMNDMILFILFLEFVVKVGAFGFGFEYLRVSIFHVDERLGYVNKQAYMENKWNQLDFVLLLIAIADAIAMGISPTMRVAGVFRAGRVLRPLRILNHYQEMKAILTAVAQSVPQVGNVFALCMLVYIIFGVVGRSIFAGKLYSCNDPAVKTAAQCVGFFLMFPDGALDLQEATAKGIPGGAILVPRVWSNARFSFDHIGVAFLALLEMTSLKWIDKVFAAMDIVAENKQPVQDHSPMFAVFFVLYVYIGSLFAIRLFVGVLVEQFQRNDGTQILTESQKSWVDLEKFVLLLKPLKLIPRPRLQIQSKLYDFCQHPCFSQAISAAILLNILLLLVNPNSTSTVSISYKVIEMMFLGIFTIEALLKCLAFRHYYLFSMNGAFEMAILVGSLVAYFSDTGYHSLIQAGRIFRVMRVLRFVKLNKGVYTIFRTFRASLRPIANIFFLMCTIIFIFAIVARQLFGGVKFGPAMNHFSNFRTFGSSVLLLFQIMSGDDWHLTMTDCMVSKPFCSERVDEVTDVIVTDCGNVTSAAAFFVTYVTLVVFVFLNLFVTVILENFRSCYLKSDVCAISLLDFEKYREVFQKYDTQGKGTFPLWQLASFLSELPASLRIERNRKRRAFLQIRSQVQVLLLTEKPKRPYFNELLRVLCIHQMGIRSLPYEQQRDRVKQIFIYRAKVAHMMVESVVKGYAPS